MSHQSYLRANIEEKECSCDQPLEKEMTSLFTDSFSDGNVAW